MKLQPSLLAATLLVLHGSFGLAEPLPFNIAEREEYVYEGNGWTFAHATFGTVDETGMKLRHIVGHVILPNGDIGEIPRKKGYSSKHDFRAFVSLLDACARAVEVDAQFEGTSCGIVVRYAPQHRTMELEVLRLGNNHNPEVYFTARLPGEEVAKYASAIAKALDAAERIDSQLRKAQRGEEADAGNVRE